MPARRVLATRRTPEPGHILLGHAQGRGQCVRPGRGRRLLLSRLRQGLHVEDASDCLRPALRSGSALLRSAGSPDRRDPDRQRPRVLRAGRSARLRAPTVHGRHRASDDARALATNQRLRRAIEPDAAR